MSAVRIPNAADPFATFDAAGLWLALPQVTRDLIGALALQATFGAFVSQDAYEEPKLFDREQRADGLDREGSAIAAMQVTIERSLPTIFGKEGEDPAWAKASTPSSVFSAQSIVAEIESIEVAFRVAKIPLSQLFERSVDRSTWTRWKARRTSPTFTNWAVVRETAERLLRSKRQAPEDTRSDSAIVGAAIRGGRGVFAPASMLTEVDR